MSRRPNIVFLMPDQLRPDFLSCYGASFLKTPNIDKLAASGIRYETCISPSPICVPARASMLTGQSAHACGVMDNLHWPRPDRSAMGLRTWAEHLANVGYLTSAIGKMHFYPWDIAEGFEHRIIAEDKRHIHIEDDFYNALVSAGHSKTHAREQAGYEEGKGASINDLPDHLQVDRWVAAQACDFLAGLADERPLALMVGFPGPHCPYDPPAEALAAIDPNLLPAPVPATRESSSHRDAFIKSYRREWADLDYSDLSDENVRGIRHHYAALVERLDTDVGAIIDALQASGRLENTIIVFASDHGDYLGDFGLVGKTYFHEPSVRVPLIVADFRARDICVKTDPVSLVDLYPSFLDWAGCDLPNYADGVALSAEGSDQRIIVGATVHGFMARSSDWKLVRYRNGTEALFDLAHDPDEQFNCVADHPDIRAMLDAALAADLLDGFGAAHQDKRVAAAQAEPNHPFYRRNWFRPYPSQ